jgi:hypothetical protein
MRRTPFPKTTLAVFVLSFLYAVLFCDKGMVMNEEGWILTEAEAILHGKVLYRDIFSFVSPGVWYLTSAAFAIFGVDLNVTRVLMALLFGATTGLVFLIALSVTNLRCALMATALMYIQKVLAFPLGNYIFYTEFAIFFSLLAAYLLLLYTNGASISLLVLSGFSLGLSIAFKQNIGLAVLSGLAAFGFIFHRSRREFIAMGAPVGAVLIVILVYFGAVAAIPDLLYGMFYVPFFGFYQSHKLSYFQLFSLSTLTPIEMFQYFPALFWEEFVYSHQPKIAEYLRPVARSIGVLIYLLPGFLTLIVLARAIRRRGWHRSELLLLILALGIFSVAFPRPDFAHVMQGMIGFVPLLTYVFHSSRSRRASQAASLGVILCLGSFSLLLVLNMPYVRLFEHGKARLYLSPGQYATVTTTLDWMERNIPEYAAVTVIPGDAMYYFLADKPVPHRYTLTLAQHIGEDRGERFAKILESENVGYVVYQLSQIPGQPRFEDYGSQLLLYLEQNYETVLSVSEKFGEHLRIMKRRSEG